MVGRIVFTLFLSLAILSVACSVKNVISETEVDAVIVEKQSASDLSPRYIVVSAEGLSAKLSISRQEYFYLKKGQTKTVCLVVLEKQDGTRQRELRRTCSSDPLKGGFMSPFLFG